MFGLSREAVQSLGLHTAVSLRSPALHDLCPDKVYPVLQVGEQGDIDVSKMQAPL